MCRIKNLAQSLGIHECELSALMGYRDHSGLARAKAHTLSSEAIMLLTMLETYRPATVRCIFDHWIEHGPRSMWQAKKLRLAASKLLGPEEYAQWGERFKAVRPELFPSEDIRKAA